MAVSYNQRAKELAKRWGLSVQHALYRKTGNWYHQLNKFPGALLDADGYVIFESEQAFKACPQLQVGKEVGAPKGIKAIPGYVRVADSDASPSLDVDIHTVAATEGRRRLVLHLQRERNQTVVRNKKKQAASFDCEVCGFSFGRDYGSAASDYCEVHHLLPLSEVEHTTRTRMEDLAILCANCHRVVHLRNPPYTLDEVRRMLALMVSPAP
jgi:5-methylcytosine-specific restriction endonuclease McrA